MGLEGCCSLEKAGASFTKLSPRIFLIDFKITHFKVISYWLFHLMSAIVIGVPCNVGLTLKSKNCNFTKKNYNFLVWKCLQQLKAGQTTFFSHFQPFLFILNLCQSIYQGVHITYISTHDENFCFL